jgi:phage terminase large subunit-like protein
VREVPYDPAQLTQFSSEMLDEGFEMVELRPTVLNFSEPMKKLGELVLEGQFHHNGDPVLAWMVGNVVFHRDHKDNIYPNKAAPQNKIDGVIALIMAMNRMSQGEPPQESVYKERGVIAI